MNNEILDDYENSQEESIWKQANKSGTLKLSLICLIALGHSYLLDSNEMLILSFISTFFLLLIGYFVFAIITSFLLTVVIGIFNGFFDRPIFKKLNEIDLFSKHNFLSITFVIAIGLIILIVSAILF